MEESSQTVVASTLYPKITNHIENVVQLLKCKLQDSKGPREKCELVPIPIAGTVKLHGTHADIIVSHNDRITFQSRNKPNLLATADNHGFATAMAVKHATILSLRSQFIARWKELNPFEDQDPELPVTIAGEWIGERIQKGVAIAELSKRFVIISAKINGRWVLDSDYSDIEAPEFDIYNVSRAGIFHVTLYPTDLQKTIDEVEPLAEKVAKNCPFAESFGITGEGEGIVWKLVPYVHDSDLWFKTKGGRFKPTFAPALKQPAVSDTEMKEAAEKLARLWCSEMRLEQGWDYLREKGIERNIEGAGEFLKWVQQDVFVEEKGYMKKNMVRKGILRTEMIAVAKPWYLKRIASE